MNFPFGSNSLERTARWLSRIGQSRLAQAAAWSTAAFILGQIARVGGNLVMTRLLAPEMFGVMAIVLAVQMALYLLCDIGIRTAVVQSKRGDEPAFLNTAWTLEILRGLTIWGVSLLVAAAIVAAGRLGWLGSGAAWSSPDLPAIIAAATFTSVITGLQSTSLATAQREINTKPVALIELAAQLVGLAVMIAYGLWTRSIWAFVVGALVSTIFMTLATHWCLPGIRNRLQLDRAAVREILDTGRWILMSSTFYVLSNQIDRFILAGQIDAAQLGIYSIAIGLLGMIELIGLRVLSLVALPSLSEVARTDRPRFRQHLFRLRLPLECGFLGAAGLLTAAAPAIIDLLYDDRYASAGQMLQILAFSLVFSRFGVFNIAYVALGQSQSLATWSLLKFLSAVLVLPVCFKLYGMTGALFAVAFHGAIPMLYNFWRNRKHGINDFRFEALILLAWPVGYAAGLVGSWMLAALSRALGIAA